MAAAGVKTLARGIRGWSRSVGLRLARWRGHRALFTQIFRHQLWGDGESVSGPGSTRSRGADFQDELIEVLRSLGTRVLLDAPCGDFNWMAPVAESVPEYIGADVVRELVDRNQARYGTGSLRFVHADLTRDPLPACDVVLCRDCLVHFSTRDARAALRNLRRSGATWLIATTFVGVEENTEIRTGGWRVLNLQRPPFNFPPPHALIDERCLHSEGRYRDKRLGVWRFDALPL
jgi:hypothetical protein